LPQKNNEGPFEDHKILSIQDTTSESCTLSLAARRFRQVAADNPSMADNVKVLLDCGVERKPLSLGTSNDLIKAAADHPSIADDVKALLDYCGVERKPLSLGTSNELIRLLITLQLPMSGAFDYFGSKATSSSLLNG
jgi:hypothetical protein